MNTVNGSLRRILSGMAVFLLLLHSAQAQVHMTNTGILKVSGATDTLFVSNNLTNSSAAALTNNGMLYVKGTLTNDQAAMAAGTGTLYLSGSSAQSVNGTATFKTYNFVSANSAGITLNEDLSVSGTHTFSSGLIHSSATPNYLVYEAGSSYTGDADSRHVTGWVKKFGSTNFSFPVGNSSYERAVSVASLASSSEIDCHYYYTGTQNLYNMNPPLIAVDSNEYWAINRISGGNFKVNLNWDNSKVPFYNVLLADILVAEYNAGLWRSLGGSASGSPATTGTINGSSNVLTAVSNYTFGFTTFPLPVKLTAFTGNRRNGVSMLLWTAQNELQAGNYEIQRSTNGLNFSTVGALPARNSGRSESYEYADAVSFSGILFYRLKMQDVSGKSSYSNVISMSDHDRSADPFVIPNPVKEVITVFSRPGVSGNYYYTLYSSNGQKIINGITSLTAGSQSVLSLPPGTTAGIYTLELRNTNTSFRQQILVNK